ncbi:SMC-Scp complex subunit ScpB [bacterium]|nr:SMC-Scp complex subunit ScpB [bacterium]|tara:strand:+ start:2608 stop:3153 length:546 start_codon:yes stop_codon:yes gene_type:complete
MFEKMLDQRLEVILFFKAQPVAKAVLAKQLNVSAEALAEAIAVLKERLEAGATRLLETDSELSLVTAPEHDALIEDLRRDELKRDIGKAGAETLAIVLYRGPITRGEIDRIRGVNSSYILRTLMVRGLIERGSSSKRVEYRATSDLLAHLGITAKTALPNYEQVLNQLDTFEQEMATETEV